MLSCTWGIFSPSSVCNSIQINTNFFPTSKYVSTCCLGVSEISSFNSELTCQYNSKERQMSYLAFVVSIFRKWGGKTEKEVINPHLKCKEVEIIRFFFSQHYSICGCTACCFQIQLLGEYRRKVCFKIRGLLGKLLAHTNLELNIRISYTLV